ncbi:MAG: hypothetical protein ACOH2R_11865 [Pseudomonas sp.]
MNVSPVKILLIVGTLFLSACSGITTGSNADSYSSLDNSRSVTANGAKTSFSGGGLGSSFNQYSQGLMQHD